MIQGESEKFSSSDWNSPINDKHEIQHMCSAHRSISLNKGYTKY